jgi:hypothetical protein
LKWREGPGEEGRAEGNGKGGKVMGRWGGRKERLGRNKRGPHLRATEEAPGEGYGGKGRGGKMR